MSKGRPVRAFDYVNHPYPRVREALSGDAVTVFTKATRAAATRAQAVAAGLHVNVAGIEVGAEIRISVDRVEEEVGPRSQPKTRMSIDWEAASRPGLFPLMSGELAIYPLTPTETQLDFSGTYEPPLGLVGSAIDAVIGHRIAEASVHRFVADVATYLRGELAET